MIGIGSSIASMAKRKVEPTGASQQHQYTSTSESVKTRPRKKRILDIPPPQPALPLLSHTSTQPHSQPPAPEHLLELTAIWDADQRTPSVLSRRAWALARNLRVDAVQRWWHRRRQTAKRAGETLLEETYELDVGTPPVLVEAVKAEEQEEEGGGKGHGVVRNTRGRAKRAKAEAQDLDTMLSSDTLVFSSPASRKRAYIHRSSSLPTSRSPSPLPPSSPPRLSSSPAPLSPPPGVQVQRKQEWCTRPGDNDEGSVFTCPLCSSVPDSLPPATSRSTPSLSSTFVFPSPDEPLTRPIKPMRWCIIGRHYALDGSFVGPCVCGPVVWGGDVLEDGLCPSSSSSVEDGLCPPLMDDKSHPLLLEDELGGQA
ncbi:hypothetical protein Hypma_013751 [Hypsizygus marmoreus]|uniref:Homeobox domain-containing protein n=1 Tax=Hypsizygus marmoreus TaxID=39966 RepID=A0A369K7U0_HYPMA|nr:hypothetical protein Hypma_013751 [Hypsizygus marmoreus]